MEISKPSSAPISDMELKLFGWVPAPGVMKVELKLCQNRQVSLPESNPLQR